MANYRGHGGTTHAVPRKKSIAQSFVTPGSRATAKPSKTSFRAGVGGALAFAGHQLDPRPAFHDAVWVAKNPIARIQGKGRAANSTMAFPMGGGGGIVPKYFSSRVPFHTIERVKPGELWLGWTGELQPHYPMRQQANRRRAREGGTHPIIYNLLDQDRAIKGSLNYQLKPTHIYANQIYVEEKMRKTQAARDFFDILQRHGKPITATFANDQLARVAKKRYGIGSEEEFLIDNSLRGWSRYEEMPSRVPPRGDISDEVDWRQRREPDVPRASLNPSIVRDLEEMTNDEMTRANPAIGRGATGRRIREGILEEMAQGTEGFNMERLREAVAQHNAGTQANRIRLNHDSIIPVEYQRSLAEYIYDHYPNSPVSSFQRALRHMEREYRQRNP